MYWKAFVTGHIIELYEYEKLNTSSSLNMADIAKGDGIYSNENYERRQQQRRDLIRRLITKNFSAKGGKFITLTFDNEREHDIKDVKQCNAYYKKFIQRLKYYYPKLKYVTVIEFQDKNKRGAVHYHMICNLPYVPKAQLEDLWGGGFIKINSIDKVDNLGAYVIKYMTKENADKRLKGLKAYNCSKGLERPVEIKSWKLDNTDKAYLDSLDIINKKPVYLAEYTSEVAGRVTYAQYNLLRP